MWPQLRRGDYFVDTNIRELKAKLSGVIRRVAAGETVTVRLRKRAVARIVPIGRASGLEQLGSTPGILWKGGKPAGMREGEALPRGFSLSDWVVKDRR
jgi:antitoxin (DNA-binding transcriptional repressor) of toxin-antitoxin stability system